MRLADSRSSPETFCELIVGTSWLTKADIPYRNDMTLGRTTEAKKQFLGQQSYDAFVIEMSPVSRQPGRMKRRKIDFSARLTIDERESADFESAFTQRKSDFSSAEENNVTNCLTTSQLGQLVTVDTTERN